MLIVYFLIGKIYPIELLAKSSPPDLFKFKFCFNWLTSPHLNSLKLFFDNWKGRHPMLIQTVPTIDMKEWFDLIEKYKAEGIVKKYDNDMSNFEEFEWIQKID